MVAVADGTSIWSVAEADWGSENDVFWHISMDLTQARAGQYDNYNFWDPAPQNSDTPSISNDIRAPGITADIWPRRIGVYRSGNTYGWTVRIHPGGDDNPDRISVEAEQYVHIVFHHVEADRIYEFALADDSYAFSLPRPGEPYNNTGDAGIQPLIEGLDAAPATDTLRIAIVRPDTDGGRVDLDALTVGEAAPPPANVEATGRPVISGTAETGQTLTVAIGNVADDNGTDDAVFVYDWRRGTWASSVSVGGGTSYTLTSADEGSRIFAIVSFTDDDGYAEERFSLATPAVEAPPPANTEATGAPEITGIVRVGETLTASIGDVADADGTADSVFAYEWFRQATLSDNDYTISLGTGSTLTIPAAVVGLRLRVRVTFTDDAGNDEARDSAPTASVGAIVTNTAATGRPRIIGAAEVGTTLRASIGDVADVNGTDDAVFAYTWYRQDTAGGSSHTTLLGTGETFTIGATENGFSVLLQVTFTDDDGFGEARSSLPSDPVDFGTDDITPPAVPAREPVTIVEMDQDLCSRTYGSAPCTAALGTDGDYKCFNTLPTCQDTANYALGDPVTLRFCYPRAGGPSDTLTILPSLRSVTSNPTEINPGGLSTNAGPLGKRATVTIVLDDHPHNDVGIDKYVSERTTGDAQADGSGYDPEARGTLWTRWLARNRYHVGRALRVYEGQAGEALDDMLVRHYVVDRIEGPTSGRITIIAKDVLTLADDDKALAPRPTTGRLTADHDETSTIFTVTPSGVGDDEYPASGKVAVGNEVMDFTRSGDNFTVTRARAETQAGAHSAGDHVQLCLEYEDEPIRDVIEELLVDYAGIDSSYIDGSEWDQEANQWLQSHRVSVVLPEPVGVASLLGELSLIGPYIWWDERERKIRLRAVRPEIATFDAADILTDDNALLRDIRIKETPKDRISQLYFYYGKIDPTQRDNPENYHRLRVATALSAEAGNQYGSASVVTLYSRWLGAGDDGLVLSVAQNLLARNRDIPRRLEAVVDAAWREYWTGDVLCLATSQITNPLGEAETSEWQVLSAREDEPGENVRLTMWPADYSSTEGAASGRYCFVEPSGQPDYDSATDAQKESPAGYISDADGMMSDGSPGWVIF